MSLQQQCLPVPNRNRKRGRVPSSPSKDDPSYTENNKDHSQSSSTRENYIAAAPPPRPPLMEIASLESMDAMDYLAFVREQASNLPDVFVSQNSLQEYCNNNTVHMQSNQSDTMIGSTVIDGSAAARDYLLSHRLDILPPPTRLHVPPASILTEWKEQTLSNFSSLRAYLLACRSEFKKWLKPEDKIPVPQSKDLYAWHVFCLGHEIRNEMEHKMIHVQMIDSIHDSTTAVEVDVLLSPYKIPKGGYEPTTRLMCQFDQIIIRRLLSHHLRYIAAGCTVTVKRIQWIYAILARLDKPLHRDEASVLMELLRELCRVRGSSMVLVDDGDLEEGQKKKKEEEELEHGKNRNAINNSNQSNLDGAMRMDVVKAINVLVLVIGIYFEQYNHLEKLLAYHPPSDEI